MKMKKPFNSFPILEPTKNLVSSEAIWGITVQKTNKISHQTKTPKDCLISMKQSVVLNLLWKIHFNEMWLTLEKKVSRWVKWLFMDGKA